MEFEQEQGDDLCENFNEMGIEVEGDEEIVDVQHALLIDDSNDVNRFRSMYHGLISILSRDKIEYNIKKQTLYDADNDPFYCVFLRMEKPIDLVKFTYEYMPDGFHLIVLKGSEKI